MRPVTVPAANVRALPELKATVVTVSSRLRNTVFSDLEAMAQSVFERFNLPDGSFFRGIALPEKDEYRPGIIDSSSDNPCDGSANSLMPMAPSSCSRVRTLLALPWKFCFRRAVSSAVIDSLLPAKKLNRESLLARLLTGVAAAGAAETSGLAPLLSPSASSQLGTTESGRDRLDRRLEPAASCRRARPFCCRAGRMDAMARARRATVVQRANKKMRLQLPAPTVDRFRRRSLARERT